MKKLLVALILIYPLPASAQTYQWTDDRSTVNFTEDLGKVPKKYRKKMKVIGTDESGVPEASSSREPVTDKPKEIKARKDKEQLYDGKDETVWRNAFSAAKGDLKGAELELGELRGRLVDTSKLSRSEYLSIQNAIKHDELRVQDRKRKLDQLRENADKIGVPMDLR